jgi:DNA repair photolyase
MREITRKSLLYKTKVEYGDWALNHAQGCAHSCTYPCYARRGWITPEEWANPAIVRNALDLLKKEIPLYQDMIKNVHLSFSTDPFMYGFPEVQWLTLRIVRELNSHGIPCTILTKGVYPVAKIRTMPRAEINSYGVTLVSAREDFRRQWEPGAAPLKDRIGALRRLAEAGLRTWVSMEPWVHPRLGGDADVGKILAAVDYVDRIVFGRLNYRDHGLNSRDVRAYYAAQARKVIDYCRINLKDCHIKSGTM